MKVITLDMPALRRATPAANGDTPVAANDAGRTAPWPPAWPCVVAVCASTTHQFSKDCVDSVMLRAGLGVEEDAHSGATVQHRSRVAANPDQPNLRQVHLIAAELFDELRDKGFSASPGELGENITTRGITLTRLPEGTELHIGGTQGPVVRLTGLRNPCAQLDRFQPGLTAAVLERDPAGTLVRKAGVMGVVLVSGIVRGGDSIKIRLPRVEHRQLERI